MQRYFLRTDPAFSAALFAILATAYALTRSHWLDDWDSVQFALALDDFDLRKHQPHPPGYPVYIAAAKVLRTVVPDAAAVLTLLSSLAGAACASLFFLITRRDLDRTTALASTLIMAVSPLFWLQAGLALTDMFGFFFVMLFILLEGTAPTTRAGTIWRAIGCGLVAGISIGARPHFTLLILVYWLARTFFIDRSRAPAAVAAAALFAGFLIWFLPAAAATGGFDAYFDTSRAQFEWRFDNPEISVLGASIDAQYLLYRAGAFFFALARSIGPIDSHSIVLGAIFLMPFLLLAWWSTNPSVTRPYIIALAFYFTLLFVILPAGNQRYFLPFTAIVGWSTPRLLALSRRRPALQAAVFGVLFVFNAVPTYWFVKELSKTPPPVAALEWVGSTHPDAIFHSSELARHARVYLPLAEIRGTDPSRCSEFATSLASGRPVLSTLSTYCGIDGSQVAVFDRDRRVHRKHHFIAIYVYNAPAEASDS
ncbi:ArnT family glycosyltransferase [Oricola sp.]|uniref:ArnT family glycosyltransferase n=1 Tax=Oricola sp. TaxID=1979950 RepID=UPI003515F642